jgi:hypothetical protein
VVPPCARRALYPPPHQRPSPGLRVQGRGGAHCVGSKPGFSSAAAGAGVAGVKSMGAGAASSAASSAFSSMRSLWSLRTPHVAPWARAACAKSPVLCIGSRALVCKSKTHPCGRAGITRLRLIRETPAGEYADEASSSAMSNIITRIAIAVGRSEIREIRLGEHFT